MIKMLLKFWIFLIFTGMGFLTQLCAETATIQGVIKEIRPIKEDHFGLSLKTQDGEAKFVMTRKTKVQMVVPAQKVEVGRRILVTRAATPKDEGGADPNAPRNQSPQALDKMLANEPKMPEAQPVPELPDAVKDAKQEVMNRNPPNQPTPGTSSFEASAGDMGSRLTPEEATAAQAQAGGAPAGGQESGGAEKKKEGPEEAEIPKSHAYPVPVPEVLSAPTPETSSFEASAGNMGSRPTATEEEAQSQEAQVSEGEKPPLPKIVEEKVVQVQETKEGIAIELETPGRGMVLPPDELIVQLGSVEDLKENMSVQLEVKEENKWKFVERLTVMED